MLSVDRVFRYHEYEYNPDLLRAALNRKSNKTIRYAFSVCNDTPGIEQSLDVYPKNYLSFAAFEEQLKRVIAYVLRLKIA